MAKKATTTKSRKTKVALSAAATKPRKKYMPHKSKTGTVSTTVHNDDLGAGEALERLIDGDIDPEIDLEEEKTKKLSLEQQRARKIVYQANASDLRVITDWVRLAMQVTYARLQKAKAIGDFREAQKFEREHANMVAWIRKAEDCYHPFMDPNASAK